ncbi:hypothetical protein ACLB2K_005102 [Fragaria x ananassa]
MAQGWIVEGGDDDVVSDLPSERVGEESGVDGGLEPRRVEDVLMTMLYVWVSIMKIPTSYNTKLMIKDTVADAGYVLDSTVTEEAALTTLVKAGRPAKV